MLLPYLPDRFDASAAALSSVSRIARDASLILVPAGLAGRIARRRSRLWHRVILAMGGLIALVAAMVAVAVDQLAIGVMVGIAGAAFLFRAHRWIQAAVVGADAGQNPIPLIAVFVRVFLVSLDAPLLPRALALFDEFPAVHLAGHGLLSLYVWRNMVNV